VGKDLPKFGDPDPRALPPGRPGRLYARPNRGTSLAAPGGVTIRDLTRRARDLVSRTVLEENEEPEVERTLVAGAVVAREGSHYRIEIGAETIEEIEDSALLRAGSCDCGAPLSFRNGRMRCRSCGRNYVA
jgi:hypothetical protein